MMLVTLPVIVQLFHYFLYVTLKQVVVLGSQQNVIIRIICKICKITWLLWCTQC